jgi:Plasma-membrane choline transporter
MVAGVMVIGVGMQQRSLLCCVRVAAQVAVACIKVASQAASTMPSLLFFPLLPFLGTCALVVYWVVVTGFLWSAGQVKPYIGQVEMQTDGQALLKPMGHGCPV